ncbi:serine racemase VanT catalytic subunit [Bacillus suaedae]|uniref:Alanine racemase n=1 Tax=Halalkalibacter suaedae TaxID=2822140 RepID=A0A940WWP2_9BACI|nr:serine racemase VanT catalytic subunit [Bacillus suaedae]MBP3951907.1 serine racemase VanT catalytic subunit [Bacillus suaedae]
MGHSKITGALDLFRLLAALLVVAVHTSPLYTMDETADFVLTRIIGRFAVPFFIMVTGYFLYTAIAKRDNAYIKGFVLKIGTIYLISIILFLPINFYSGYFGEKFLWGDLIKDILFDGTFYHLWYLPAMILGVFLVTVGIQRFGFTISFLVAILLYGIGLLGDSYYGIVQQTDILTSFYDMIFTLFEYTRNGLFFIPIYLLLGMAISKSNNRLSTKQIVTGLVISSVLLLIEGLLLNSLSWQRHDSMYILLVPCMYFLFLFSLQLPGKNSKTLRDLSLIIYLIHPWMIVLVRGFAKVIDQEQLFIYNNFIHYLIVSFLSLFAGWILTKFSPKGRKRKIDLLPDNRAWVEIDLAALRHNAKELQRILPSHCQLMPVVKANAYGHGDVAIARELMRAGLKMFAVATLAEGVRLRQNGIKGDILILGYTNPKELASLEKYQLIQTVVDFPYALMLNQYPKKVRVHIKIDTGMHRLGVNVENLAEIEKVFECKNLKVEGMFSHLSTADSLADEDVRFTQKQIQQFNQMIDLLKAKGYHTGKLHIQGSYGILNYPDLVCDYARPGIALYGVLSADDKIRASVHLKPVLSLKARIALIKEIQPGEVISYGRQFTAKSNMKIATVTIGYADGIPRRLYENNAYVMLHSKRAPIIGRICMDQLMIDVSHIHEVENNDVVTIIGVDGTEQIRCEDIARQSGTITNEILSGLGPRLDYVYLD